jgi:demethylspheroidene O-methyltransferase
MMLRHWRDLRNDLIADPRFQSFAARFFLTRRIAASQARQAFDLAAGFVYSQILLACAELNLFEALRHGARSLDDLAEVMKLSRPAAERLLLGAAALGLVDKRGGDSFGLGMKGAALLGNPGAFSMIAHHRMVYADLADPVALLRRGPSESGLSDFWAYARSPDRDSIGDEKVGAYSRLMDESQTLVRHDVLDAYPLDGVARLMDVGGGEAGFAMEAARRWPKLTALAVDLPAVAQRASANIERQGLAGRVAAHGCDFLMVPLPGQHEGAKPDLASLVRVLHDHDDGPAMILLRSIRAALAPGGKLIIAEPMSGTPGAQAMGDAYFGFYLLAMGSGRPRPASEIKQMLERAGFSRVRNVPTARPLLVSVVEAS